MLRSSILYAADTYYDLKETELRELERIEEVFLRKLMKYILNQDEESLIYKLFMLQLRQPTRGDWASTCKENLIFWEMNKTHDQ